jgi:hypothetical protein
VIQFCLSSTAQSSNLGITRNMLSRFNILIVGSASKLPLLTCHFRIQKILPLASELLLLKFSVANQIFMLLIEHMSK